MKPGAIADPYPDLARDRPRVPVRPIDLGAFLPVDPAEAGAPDPIFEALSFEAVQEVFRDGERFSSAAYDDPEQTTSPGSTGWPSS